MLAINPIFDICPLIFFTYSTDETLSPLIECLFQRYIPCVKKELITGAERTLRECLDRQEESRVIVSIPHRVPGQ